MATAGTALLSLSFVFAATTQEFLGSCIFLFVKHPYDVGDRVEIQVDGIKSSLLVERISLLYTVFVRTDKMQIVQTPNIVLNNLWVENTSRSGPQYECITLEVSYDNTSFEDVELLRLEMEKFVQHPDNARDFQPDFGINIVGVGAALDRLQIEVLIKHKSNWHDGALRAERHSRFMSALTDAMKKIPIYPVGRGFEILGSVGNPSYMVSVSDDDAAGKREQADKNKEALRMVPSGAKGPDELAAAAAEAPGGATAPGPEGDWFNRSDRPSMQEGTRISLESRRSELPKRGESAHKGGLRKAGETLSTTLSHQGSVSAPRGSSSLRHSGSRRAYDEEAQVGSPTAPTQGGFLAPSASQTGRSPSSQYAQGQRQSQEGLDPYRTHSTTQGHRRLAGGPPPDPPADGAQ